MQRRCTQLTLFVACYFPSFSFTRTFLLQDFASRSQKSAANFTCYLLEDEPREIRIEMYARSVPVDVHAFNNKRINRPAFPSHSYACDDTIKCKITNSSEEQWQSPNTNTHWFGFLLRSLQSQITSDHKTNHSNALTLCTRMIHIPISFIRFFGNLNIIDYEVDMRIDNFYAQCEYTRAMCPCQSVFPSIVITFRFIDGVRKRALA